MAGEGGKVVGGAGTAVVVVTTGTVVGTVVVVEVVVVDVEVVVGGTGTAGGCILPDSTSTATPAKTVATTLEFRAGRRRFFFFTNSVYLSRHDAPRP